MGHPQRRIGQLLGGKYRVQQLLALGGMGVIYSACHALTGRSVAIKLLRPELSTRPDLLRRVSIEARLAVEASHPNVVEVLDAGADDAGIPYLVLERLYGQPLEALIAERVPLLATVQALLPVMNALVSLHGAGIVHRDIKPSNIFLSCEGERVVPKLLDFGIAKALASADSSLSSVALGTPSYMAPEQALGCLTLGPTSDVWSVGVVLVRSLTGRLPFAALAKDGPSALRSGLNPDQLEHVPQRVGLVLARALQLDPRDRFPSMAEFRSALLGALRQVDELENWPGEESIAYPFHEFSLAAALPRNAAGGVETPSSGGDDRPARPHDMLTRTLSKVWPGAPARVRIPWVVGALVALCATGALIAWRPADSAITVPSSGHRPAAFVATATAQVLSMDPSPNEPGPRERASVEIASATPVASVAERSATPSPSAVSIQARAPQPQKPRRPPLRDSLESNLPLPLAQAPPGDAASPPLGPNRSPIIE